MNESSRAKLILKILNKIYPKTPIPLKHKNKFTLLVSVALSAQTTDVNVNKATKNIYPKYNKPEHFVKLGLKGKKIGDALQFSLDHAIESGNNDSKYLLDKVKSKFGVK